MGLRRERHYPARVNIGLDAATKRKVAAASKRFGIAESVILRRAIAGGLDRAIDALRKSLEPKGERGTEE